MLHNYLTIVLLLATADTLKSRDFLRMRLVNKTVKHWVEDVVFSDNAKMVDYTKSKYVPSIYLLIMYFGAHHVDKKQWSIALRTVVRYGRTFVRAPRSSTHTGAARYACTNAGAAPAFSDVPLLARVHRFECPLFRTTTTRGPT